MGHRPENMKNIISLQRFEAAPDVEILIGVSDIILLMPIFRWCEDKWIDATGDYDLCMTPDGFKMTFVSRRPLKEIYGYRFFPADWLAHRMGRPFG